MGILGCSFLFAFQFWTFASQNDNKGWLGKEHVFEKMAFTICGGQSLNFCIGP